METIRKLDDLQESDKGLYGGKAVNLAKLIQRGFNVPKGYALAACNTDNHPLLGKITSDANLSSTKFAVRSSAIQEDGTQASWAGQYLSLLDVKPTDLLTSITMCRESAWRNNVADYCTNSHCKQFIRPIGVIIQEMIHGEISGVTFTKNPVTGDDEVVTEYCKGACEQLVSGLITPQRQTTTKQCATVQEDKTEATVAEILERVHSASLEIEKLFNLPVDIEWTSTDKQVFILQARPITTL